MSKITLLSCRCPSRSIRTKYKDYVITSHTFLTLHFQIMFRLQNHLMLAKIMAIKDVPLIISILFCRELYVTYFYVCSCDLSLPALVSERFTKLLASFFFLKKISPIDDHTGQFCICYLWFCNIYFSFLFLKKKWLAFM